MAGKDHLVLQPLADADRKLLEEVSHGLSAVSPDNIHAVIDALVGGQAVSCAVPLSPLETLQALVVQYGVRRLIRSLEKKVMRQLQEQAGVSSSSDLQRQMEQGLLPFLSDRCPVNILRLLCSHLGLDALPRSDLHEATEREHQLADEIMLGGVEALLYALPAALLRVLCKELAIDITPKGPEDLADAILIHLFDLTPLPARELEAKRRRREEVTPDPRKKKAAKGKSRYKAPPLSNIKKGISKQELHDLYNFSDLQEYCRAQGLDFTGKKALLIRRIVLFLDTGDKGAPKPRKRKHFQ